MLIQFTRQAFLSEQRGQVGGGHSGIYDHKNETQILEIVAFIVQFYTYFNTYDMN